MKKWVAIVFSVYLLMASSPFFAVAKQDVSARETAKEVTEQVAKQFTREGVKTGAKAAEKAAQTAQRAAGARGVNQAFKPLQRVSQSQAEEVAKAVGGKLSMARNGEGYVIKLGHPKRPTVIRLMNEGSGQRGQAYFRIAKKGNPAYTREGIRSTNHALTHIDLHTGDIAQQIQEVLNNIPKK